MKNENMLWILVTFTNYKTSQIGTYITWGQNLYGVEFEHSLILCFYMSKVNSVQEACAKSFAVYMLKFEIFPIKWKKWNNEHQTLSFQFLINLFSILMFFVLFLHAACKISNFNKWTAKHLVQASCTELALRLDQYIMVKFTKNRM